MDDGAQVRVVEVEHVRADAVHQRGVQDVHALLAAEHAGLRRPGEGRQRADRDIDGFVPRPAHGAAHPVQQRARGFFADAPREGPRAARVTTYRASLRVTSLAAATTSCGNGAAEAATVPAIAEAVRNRRLSMRFMPCSGESTRCTAATRLNWPPAQATCIPRPLCLSPFSARP